MKTETLEEEWKKKNWKKLLISDFHIFLNKNKQIKTRKQNSSRSLYFFFFFFFPLLYFEILDRRQQRHWVIYEMKNRRKVFRHFANLLCDIRWKWNNIFSNPLIFVMCYVIYVRIRDISLIIVISYFLWKWFLWLFFLRIETTDDDDTDEHSEILSTLWRPAVVLMKKITHEDRVCSEDRGKSSPQVGWCWIECAQPCKTHSFVSQLFSNTFEIFEKKWRKFSSSKRHGSSTQFTIFFFRFLSFSHH